MQPYFKMLDIHVSYLCRTTYRNAEGKHPIVLRISYRGQRKDVFTGLYCFKQQWINKAGKVDATDKQSIIINRNLDAIHHKVRASFDELKYSNRVFTIHDLVNKIKGKEEPPQTLMEYIDVKLAEIETKVGIDITKQTFYKYRRAKQYVSDFIGSKSGVRNIAVSSIDDTFLAQFFNYLRKEKNNGHNSALAILNCLKAVLRSAIKTGILRSNPFDELNISVKPTYREYLTKEELDKIIGLEFESEFIDRTRDIFLFGCFTGLSYSDIQQLDRNHIILDSDDTFHISKERQKTGIISIVPIIPAAFRILLKYSSTEDIRDFSWYIPSNQKLNRNLKVIGDLGGIEKQLHMHLARHTFATTVTLSNGVPLETVSKMLGHASTKMTQHYARVLAEKVKMDMLIISRLYV